MFYYILVLHWLADFVCQSDKMAINKSSSIKWLSIHVLSYSLIMFLGLIFCVPFETNISFLIVNFVMHFITDLNTSRLNAWLYKKSRHWFFVGIGFDQLIHMITLFYFYNVILI